MQGSNYEDKSYAPIGTSLIYRRGDGATVTLAVQGGNPARLPPITPTGEVGILAAPPQIMPVITQPATPKLSRDIFDDALLETTREPAITRATLPLTVPQTLKLATGVTPVKAGKQSPTDDTIYDSPHIGGKFTVFVLFYGENKYHQLHRQCLDAIIATVPGGRMDLRVGSNQLCDESVRYIDSYVQAGLVRKHYRHVNNDRKYPVMREMFWDPSLPIETKWLLWFDDDSIADRNRDWLRILASCIDQNADAAMFGAKLIWTVDPGQANFLRRRPWHKGKAFRARNGNPSPNGNTILFAHGGFWALRTDAMRACDIPDRELGHNGGDYTIGEQLYQGGFTLKSWNGQKQYVHTSSVPRRGLTERHFGK
jgi:hypothetical protein